LGGRFYYSPKCVHNVEVLC